MYINLEVCVWGGGGGGVEKERKERKDMLRAGQSKVVKCLNGVMHYKT